MLFTLTFDVTFANGGRETVTTRPATDVAFERKFERTLASLFMSAPLPKDGEQPDTAAFARWFGDTFRAEWTYFLAHHASRTPLPFDEWLDTVTSIGWKFGGAVDPTQPGPSAS
jgi:hypothetical protein